MKTCCGYSREAPPHGEIRKISVLLGFKAILSFFFFNFIDHKPRLTQIDSFEFNFFISCL